MIVNGRGTQRLQAGLDGATHGRRRLVGMLLPVLLVALWLAIGGVGGPYAGKLASVASNDSASFLPASAESTRAEAEAAAFTKGAAVPAVVVAARESGITATDQAFLATARARIANLAHVDGAGISPPIPSTDGNALEMVVPIDGSAIAGDAVTQIRQTLADPPAGLTVLVTGPAGLLADMVTAFSGIDGTLLIVAAIAVLLILVVVYRSIVLPLLVLLSAVLALGLASFVVYLLAKNGVITLNGQSQGIMFILVFGAATDYALLLVSRFREQLRDTGGKAAAMGLAWRGVLEPITASAGTVTVGVLCLLLSDLNSNRGLGPVAAIGIAAAYLASMTFLPAVLALLGRAAFWPRRPLLGSPHPETSGAWGRLAGWISRRRRPIWGVVTIGLLVLVAFLPGFKASGTAQTAVFRTPVDSVAGQDLLAEHFPGGSGSPTTIFANADRASQVETAAHVPGVAEVRPATGPDGVPAVAAGRVEIQATLTAADGSEAALNTVTRIRDAVHAVPGADALVGGQDAVQLDTRTTSDRDLKVIIPVVLVVIFLILALLLRALVAPLLLISTVVLSFAATIGVAALVFNHLFHFPGADPAVPLYGFIFLVALGVDYNIFLMTRVREESLRLGTRKGTTHGLAVTGGVITSAGVVLAATFAALSVIPILFLAEIAFIVAFGVLLDTLIVRTLLVPAAVLDIGPTVWWPSRLAADRGSAVDGV